MGMAELRDRRGGSRVRSRCWPGRVPVWAIHPGEGVELEDGTRLRSSTVLCNADPKSAARDARGLRSPTMPSRGAWRSGRSAARLSPVRCRSPSRPAELGRPPRVSAVGRRTQSIDKCAGSMLGGTVLSVRGLRRSEPAVSRFGEIYVAELRTTTRRRRPPRASTCSASSASDARYEISDGRLGLTPRATSPSSSST